MKISKEVSHQQVTDAIKKFEEGGGIIHKLPDQQLVDRPIIGKEKYHNFESLTSFIAW